MHAHYNITTDKLHIITDGERLDSEQYAAAKAAGFTLWHGSKQFVSKWSTHAEDFIINALGLEVEENDEPDDTKTRVDRFSKYADRAEDHADSAADYLAERANTARRRKNAVNAINRELSAAEHWQQRIAGAIRHAQYKERPDVIARRIKGLEADARKYEKQIHWQGDPKISWHIRDYVLKDETGEPVRSEAGKLKLDMPAIEAAHAPTKAWAQRWLDHISNRLQYERALLAAAGGIAADSKPLEIGGAIMGRWQNDSKWSIIAKVNPVSVTILYPFTGFTKESNYTEQATRTARTTVPKTDIKGIMTAAEVAASDEYIYGRDEVKPPKAKKTTPQPEPQPVEEVVSQPVAEVAARNHVARMEQIKELQPVKVAARAKVEEIRERREDAEGQKKHIETMSSLPKIPGFFPTPRAVVEKMLEAAEIEPGHLVLEPSAGAGHIADAVAAAGAKVHLIEKSFTLAEILRKKYENADCRDFMEFDAPLPYRAEGPRGYDRVLMNPPFENLQDVAHVMHAYKSLRPGGKLVAIMGESAFFRSDNKAREFRLWLDMLGGTSEKLPEGSFKMSDVSTGVNTRMVIIEKPAEVEAEPVTAPAACSDAPQLALF